MFSVIFPGQGSQLVGMGKELYDKFDIVQKFFKEADEVLDFPISRLILEGPKDKLITFITLKKQKDQIKINSNLLSKIKKLSFLKKKSLNKLLDFEMDKVCRLLSDYKRPYRIITLKKCDEYEIGYLMMNFMLETIILAFLNNLNPFDQPAIDKGKSIKLK